MLSAPHKLSLLILGAALVLSPTLAQADYPPEGIISTMGHGEVKVKPDSLSLSMMVEATASELPAARAENHQKMQAIIAALKGLNIPNLRLETQNVQVYPMQGEYEKDRLPKILGYRVTNGLNITVEKVKPEVLGEYGSKIADAALTKGANHLQGMQFFLSDMADTRIKALAAAIADAQRNAQAMATAAGLTVSGVHSIEGTPQYHVYPMDRPMSMRAQVAPAAGVTNATVEVEPGESTVVSDVTVRFKF